MVVKGSNATGLTILCAVLTSLMARVFSAWCPEGGQGEGQRIKGKGEEKDVSRN